MMDRMVLVDGVSKKFCKSLKRSLWYGVADLGAEITGRTLQKETLRQDEFWAVQDVSFELKRGDTVGMIGHNGAGKTTLLRMLNGLIKPDAGTIVVQGRMQALIALGAGFNPILTGRENVYINAAVLGIPKAEIDQQFESILDFAGVETFIDAPVQSYSSGMIVRLGFAVAAHLNPDILLVDEVLAVGDEGFQTKCLNKIGELKKNGTAIILVSHNMHSISTFAREVILMNQGRHTQFQDVSEGISHYRELFDTDGDDDIQKVTSGNTHLQFTHVEIQSQHLTPGETFQVTLHYSASCSYTNVEVDMAIYSSNDAALYYQATNHAYNQPIDLGEGTHTLEIQVGPIQIQDATGRLAISIWAEERSEVLFWWRIPLNFKNVPYSTGSNFLQATYRISPCTTAV